MSLPQNQQFFPTEAHIFTPQNQFKSGQINAFLKIKELKNHVKQLRNYHNRALSEKIRTQKSLGQISRSTQKTKVNFIKLYENKKMKLMSKQKIQNKKLEDREHYKSVNIKTKERKLIDELHMSAAKNEEDEKNQIRKQQYRRQKQKIAKEIKVLKVEDYMNCRQKYVRSKEYRSQTMMKNKKYEEINYMRAKLNYADKAERQMMQIKKYQKLLEQLQDVENREAEFRPMTAFSKTFFVTNNQYEVMDTQEKPISTRGTYRARSRHY